MDLILIQQFATALGLSILIGLEREQNKQKSKHNISFAGLRTFALFGVTGFLAFRLAAVSMVYFGFLAAGVLALILASYVIVAFKHGRIGVTSEIAGILTFVMGGLCAMDQLVLATVLALVLLSVLYYKVVLHKLAKRLQEVEITSTIKFMIIAFVVLPLLPNQGYGPYEVLNPYIIWLMVVFISGISFASYIAIKLLGERKGIGLTGFLAGLVSSTALALSFSKKSRENQKIVNPFVVAVVVASTAMYLRVLFELSILNRELVVLACVPLLSMAFIGVIASIGFWFWKDDEEKVVAEGAKKEVYKMESPFTLAPALKFGFFFAAILLVAKFGQVFFGHESLYIVSLISGLLDVDAITVSVANIAKTGAIDASVAVTSITFAVIMNTLFKVGVFLLFGSKKAALRVSIVFGVTAVTGFVSLVFV